MSLKSVLFPDPPRNLPGRRGLKITLRAIDVLCAGALVDAYDSWVAKVASSPVVMGASLLGGA